MEVRLSTCVALAWDVFPKALVQPVAFFAVLIGFLWLITAYAKYGKRTAPPGNPPDPSIHWTSCADCPDESAVQIFRYTPGDILLMRNIALLSILPGFVMYMVWPEAAVGLSAGTRKVG
jgi:hypothetical protein